LRLRDEFHEYEFDLDRVAVPREAEAPRKPPDVRIDGDPRRVEGIAENHVGGLAADAGERDEFVERAGHFPAEPLDNGEAAGPNVFRLILVEARWLDELLEFLDVAASEVLGRLETSEEGRRDEVHAGVGALRREDRGDEQLQRTFVRECTEDLAVKRFQG